MNINKRHSKLKSWSNKTPNASYTHRWQQGKSPRTFKHIWFFLPTHEANRKKPKEFKFLPPQTNKQRKTWTI